MRTAVVTGGNRGIGYAVAESLRDKGFRVVALVRDPTAADRVRDALGVDVVPGDLSSARTVAAAADALRTECPTIDVLVHNAGLWPTSPRHNEDGLELAFAVNHLAPFQLNLALEDRLRTVVQVSAGLYVKGRVDPDRTPTGKDFHRIRTYCDTKLANLLLLPLFARRWQDAGISVNAVHPGVIRTRLGDPGGPLGLVLRLVKRTWQPPEAGARPVVRLADPDGLTGRYFEVDEEKPGPADEDLAQRLWRQAVELTGARDAG
ncbi:SDR family NAD(P)-dependent oxidoreductase [Actinophytocola xanthii]|uniref:Retinol dehydrogenase n=1 Tax=Actinophytocola xanthii TaxID=1912961 RepID=A0A1Q8CRA8_9PSEU|nr:SDR family NAD(P)-dependent oxidoreductase [Actinophytocola xanthii]OLF16882.1 retinol dehydrogenase [Actinophytocola xanthii]